MSDSQSKFKHLWQENLEGLSLAIIMALALKYFVLEAYKIPTGSMQPTLMGIDQPDLKIFDRILVDKLAYFFREPRRWEVIVFKFPLEQSKNYIKRLIGLPGERVRLREGNIYLQSPGDSEFHIARKPKEIQKDLWKNVYHIDPQDEDPNLVEEYWKREAGNWQLKGNIFTCSGAGQLRFRKTILDVYNDGYPRSIKNLITKPARGSAINSVGDLSLSFRVRPQKDCSKIAGLIAAGDQIFQFSMPGPAGSGPATVTLNGKVLGDYPLSAPLPDEYEVRFSHYDDCIELEVDGKSWIYKELPPRSDSSELVSSNQVKIETQGGGATFLNVRIDRDIYYTKEGPGEWSVPPGKFFFMGDNTQNSYDGRLWQELSYRLRVDEFPDLPEKLYGDLGSVDQNPRIVSVESGENLNWFNDQFGESYFFPDSAKKESAQMLQPFVPREFIIGRAVLVFWPLPPFSPVPRLKWIL